MITHTDAETDVQAYLLSNGRLYLDFNGRAVETSNGVSVEVIQMSLALAEAALAVLEAAVRDAHRAGDSR